MNERVLATLAHMPEQLFDASLALRNIPPLAAQWSIEKLIDHRQPPEVFVAIYIERRSTPHWFLVPYVIHYRSVSSEHLYAIETFGYGPSSHPVPGVQSEFGVD